jgi:hypothetical protein
MSAELLTCVEIEGSSHFSGEGGLDFQEEVG